MFTRRIPDALHVVPLDGFHMMSEWADDYPSIEARSTGKELKARTVNLLLEFAVEAVKGPDDETTIGVDDLATAETV